MRIQTILAFAGAGALLAGCVTLGPKYTADAAAQPDRATVYVYRPGVMGAALSPNVTANGVPLADLPAHGYFVYYAAPGELELAAKTEARTSVTLDVQAGKTYYVKGSIGIGFFVGHPHLVLVSSDVGEREIKDCQLAPGTVPTSEAVAAGHPPKPNKT